MEDACVYDHPSGVCRCSVWTEELSWRNALPSGHHHSRWVLGRFFYTHEEIEAVSLGRVCMCVCVRVRVRVRVRARARVRARVRVRVCARVRARARAWAWAWAWAWACVCACA